MSRPRIVFMGTPRFAVPSLLACAEVGEIAAVVTQPDKPKGRGQEVAAPPVKVAALERGWPVLQPAKLRGTTFHEELAALKPDVSVVTAYGKILPKAVLDAPRRGSLNVHASLLPRFRGAAPIQWAIASGDAKTGVCLMLMDEGLDTGPVLLRRELPIEATDTSASLHDKLSQLGGEVIREGVPRWVAGELTPQPQPNEGVVLAPLIEKEEGHLDFRRSAVELERRMRAFFPWPGAYVTSDIGMIKVHAAQVRSGRGEIGTVLAAGPDGIEVACGEGSLLLTELQPQGKRRMKASEFLAGRKIAPGSRPFR